MAGFRHNTPAWLASRLLDMKVGSKESTDWKLTKSNLGWWCSTPRLLYVHGFLPEIRFPFTRRWTQTERNNAHCPKIRFWGFGSLVITYCSFKAKSRDFFHCLFDETFLLNIAAFPGWVTCRHMFHKLLSRILAYTFSLRMTSSPKQTPGAWQTHAQ